jgi:hypothetical protein
MTILFQFYMVSWLFLCGVALGLISRNPSNYGFNRRYAAFLFLPWKIAVFTPAFIFVTFAGQFSFDDTWDYVNGAGMSILTFLTAPWAVGVLFKPRQPGTSKKQVLVAVVALMFSSSWFYDGWLIIRDGYYPSTWLPNLLLSPVLYAAGGLLWNLEIDENKKASFGFFRQNWPETPSRSLNTALILKAAPFIIIAAFILIFSVKWQFLDWSLIDLMPNSLRQLLFKSFT